MMQKGNTALEWIVGKLLEDLNQFHCTYRSLNSDVVQDIQIALVCIKILHLSMNHLVIHINQDINRRYKKLRIQKFTQLNTGAIEIQQLNPTGSDI